MSVKLLANENFPAPAIKRLRAQGIDVVAVAETMPASSDEQVLEFARRDGRWIVTSHHARYRRFVVKPQSKLT